MSTSLNISIMPSESSFKKQVEIAREALKNFNTVKTFKSSVVARAAMVELIDATVAFNSFIPFFLKDPAFQEIPTAVHTVLEEYSSQNPSFVMPTLYSKIISLDARVKDFVLNGKKGMLFFLLFHSTKSYYILLSSSLDSTPSAPRADRVRKPRATVCFFYLSFCPGVIDFHI
jgi:hypothetical protein